MQFCVLASGSGGNCGVVRFGGRAMLLDAGLSPLRTTRELLKAGLRLDQIEAICLTHLDQDHFRPSWLKVAAGFGVRLHLHRWHLPLLQRMPEAEAAFDQGLVRVFDGNAFEPMAQVRVSPTLLPHDQKGTVGFHIEALRGWQPLLRGKRVPLADDVGAVVGRLGYATDLGQAPRTLIERFTGVDVIAIESNYDPRMQAGSSRPWFLKDRIMGGKGHLSNEQAFDVVRQITSACPAGGPQHVVLLHQSAQCNDPAIIMRVFNQIPAIGSRVVLTHQRKRTRWLDVRPKRGVARGQLRLFDSFEAGAESVV